MRNLFGLFVAAILILSGGSAFAAGSVITMAAGSEHWTKPPSPGGQGVMQAVLLGNPNAAGYYVVRIKEPANYRILPHTHPQRQNITVLSGTYYLGMGTTFNRSTATAYPAGSFVSIPAHVAHYAFAGSSGAILQEDGMGPSVNQMIKK